MLGSVVALIGTAVVVGLIASGQLLGDEGIDVMAFADKHLNTNRFQIQTAVDRLSAGPGTHPDRAIIRLKAR